LVVGLPPNNGPLVLSLEFLTTELLLLTNRGSNLTIDSRYILINVTNDFVLWNFTKTFDTLDNPEEIKPFVPTIVNEKYVYVTNSSLNNEHSITAFNFSLLTGQSVPLWVYTFRNPNFPTATYDLGIPLFIQIPSSNGLIITSLSSVDLKSTGLNYLLAFDSLTGELMWTQNFTRPIRGYAAHPDPLLKLIVSTTDTIWGYNVRAFNVDFLWNYTTPGILSAPTIDDQGNVYICENGTISGYSVVQGNVVAFLAHPNSKGNLCDQPIVVDKSLLVRTNIGEPQNGVLYVEIGSLPPVNPPTPGSENETGMIVGICIGVLFILLLVVVIIKFRRRRNRGKYQNVN